MCVVRHDGSPVPWDLWTMAVLLDDEHDVVPARSNLVAVLTETSFVSTLRADIVGAQDADPEYAAIKDKLRQVDGPPPAERMMYQLVEDCWVVPEQDGTLRLVVPTRKLQLAVCRHCHDESGHQDMHCTLQA